MFWISKRITKTLLLINLILFLLLHLSSRPDEIEAFLGLSRLGLEKGFLWQLGSYLFIHDSFFHLLFNGLTLWFVGRELEPILGSQCFLGLYFSAGILGGILQLLFGPEIGILIGASGSICGLLLAWITLFPEASLTLLLFFFLPITVKAKILGWSLVGGSVLLWISDWNPQIAHFAHLGGFLAGFLFAKGYLGKTQTGSVWTEFRKMKPITILLPLWTRIQKRAIRIKHPLSSPRTPLSPQKQPHPCSAHPLSTALKMQRSDASCLSHQPTVDEVLDKVIREGIQNLTAQERKVLEEASRSSQHPPRT